MAYAIDLFDISLIASTDLSDNQFYMVGIDSDGKAELTGDGAHAIGVLFNDPDDEEVAQVRTQGIAKVITGEAVDEGERVASDTNGKAKTATDGDWVLGIALTESGEEDTIISILITHNGVEPA